MCTTHSAHQIGSCEWRCNDSITHPVLINTEFQHVSQWKGIYTPDMATHRISRDLTLLNQSDIRYLALLTRFSMYVIKERSPVSHSAQQCHTETSLYRNNDTPAQLNTVSTYVTTEKSTCPHTVINNAGQRQLCTELIMHWVQLNTDFQHVTKKSSACHTQCPSQGITHTHTSCTESTMHMALLSTREMTWVYASEILCVI